MNMNWTAPAWSADEKARVAELTRAGLTAAQIAASFAGRSKSAVIGLWNRDPALRTARGAMGGNQQQQPRKRAVKPRLAPPREPVAVAGTLLEDIPAGCCHWPINDGAPFMFCAEPVDPDNNRLFRHYCAAHADMARGRPASAEDRARAEADRLRSRAAANRWR